VDGVAIVTGASRGIGLATTRVLLRRGATVLAVSRASGEFEATLNGLRAEGLELVSMGLDVGDASAVERAVAHAAELGSLKLVVNCAGIIEIAAVEATTPETWERIIRTNLTGPFLFSRASIPHLRAAGGGAIVNVSSVAGTGGAGFSAAYGASKAALVNFSQALAAELVGDGIRVCAVSPGMIDTSMGQELLDTFHALFGIDTDAYVAAVQGRLGTPDEVAELIAWLGSDEASAMSGAHVVADLGQRTRLL
jgi:NAD(P)-dependent dehydrogenase (short-subunit alcohol dehydrogenase family)